MEEYLCLCFGISEIRYTDTSMSLLYRLDRNVTPNRPRSRTQHTHKGSFHLSVLQITLVHFVRDSLDVCGKEEKEGSC